MNNANSTPLVFSILTLYASDISACHGWLNKNESLRNETTKWAESLNAQYEIIMKTAKTDFPNLNLRYFYAPLQEMIENYVKKGGAATDVIEPSDGFHPSQLGNELLGELLWNHLVQDFPEAIGEVNPYNGEIRKRFGDQGGF